MGVEGDTISNMEATIHAAPVFQNLSYKVLEWWWWWER